jgi:hypothetical protein
MRFCFLAVVLLIVVVISMSFVAVPRSRVRYGSSNRYRFAVGFGYIGNDVGLVSVFVDFPLVFANAGNGP